jgi:hypothetical protein
MIACEATIAARIAIIKDGYSIPGGAALKNGFAHALLNNIVSSVKYLTSGKAHNAECFGSLSSIYLEGIGLLPRMNTITEVSNEEKRDTASGYGPHICGLANVGE